MKDCDHITPKGLTWMGVTEIGIWPFKKVIIEKRCDNCQQILYFTKSGRAVKRKENLK